MYVFYAGVRTVDVDGTAVSAGDSSPGRVGKRVTEGSVMGW